MTTEKNNKEERARYEKKSCDQLREILKGRSQKVLGTKAQLIERLFAPVDEEQEKITAINQCRFDDIERTRLMQKEQRLLQKKNNELKKILKARGLKVGGKKSELIDRLLGREKKTLKPIEQSAAAKLLERDVFEENDIHNNKIPMDAEAVYDMRPQYQKYSFEEFVNLLDLVRDKHKLTRKKAQTDDKRVRKQLNHLGGMEEQTFWGYQSWRNHPGKPLLRQDMDQGKHLTMKPSLLRDSRPEYSDLPYAVFRKRIAQETLARKQANYNAKVETAAACDSEDDLVYEWSSSDDDDDDDDEDSD
jgi:hypothetical protein